VSISTNIDADISPSWAYCSKASKAYAYYS